MQLEIAKRIEKLTFFFVSGFNLLPFLLLTRSTNKNAPKHFESRRIKKNESLSVLCQKKRSIDNNSWEEIRWDFSPDAPSLFRHSLVICWRFSAENLFSFSHFLNIDQIGTEKWKERNKATKSACVLEIPFLIDVIFNFDCCWSMSLKSDKKTEKGQAWKNEVIILGKLSSAPAKCHCRRLFFFVVFKSFTVQLC